MDLARVGIGDDADAKAQRNSVQVHENIFFFITCTKKPIA